MKAKSLFCQHHDRFQGIRFTLAFVWYQVDDDEIFKICTEYWNFLADDLYHKEVQMQRPMAALMLSPTPLAQSPRLQTYSPILAQARRILIDRMPKPEVCGTPLRTQTCRHIVGEGGSLSKTTQTLPPLVTEPRFSLDSSNCAGFSGAGWLAKPSGLAPRAHPHSLPR